MPNLLGAQNEVKQLPTSSVRTGALSAVILATTLLISDAIAAERTASDILRSAFENWRGKSSAADVSMTVIRPSWKRTLKMKVWTQGESDGLVRFIAPAKDAGNATLKRSKDAWMFNPRLNQVIKLPSSAMAQSWMGSDLSHNDLLKANDLLTDYVHRLIDTAAGPDHRVHVIEAIPKPDAAVVWGKRVVRVRDDDIILEDTYFDQDMKPVKRLVTQKIGLFGGRMYPIVIEMHSVGRPGHSTRIEHLRGQFDRELAEYLFTLSNLRNPRR